MSSESQKSVSYVMTKSVSTHMEDDVLKLPSFTPTQQAVTELQRYERDDIIVTDASGKAIGIVTDQDMPPVVNPAALEKNPLANASTGVS